MKSVFLLIGIIGCAVATGPIVTTLSTGLDQNTLHIQNGPPFGGSISASLPSIRSVAEPILSQLAPLALSLGNFRSGGDSPSLLGDLASLGSLPTLSDLASLVSLGAHFLPQLPSSVQVHAAPVSIAIPFPIPSFTPVSYSASSLVPYPYTIYASAGFH